MSFDTGESTTDFGKDGIDFLFSSQDSGFSGFFEVLGEGGEEVVVDLDLDGFLVFELREADFEL